MGRAPCCDKENVKRGPWSPEEDAKLKGFIDKYGTGGNWIALPQKAGLKRCGKSCRLRWLNYLRPNIKHGEFTDDEDKIICSLYANIGSRWSIIAGQLPGRTDNDIKNYWNTKLKKKLLAMLPIPSFHKRPPFFPSLQSPTPPYNRPSDLHFFTTTHDTSSPPANFNNNTTINTSNLIMNTALVHQDHININTNSTNSLISLITNNINENPTCYLGFDQGGHQQSLYNTTTTPLMEYQYYPAASDVKEAMLMFGSSSAGEGHEVSTTGSSSEGGSCLSQISYGNYSNKDHHLQIKQEDQIFIMNHSNYMTDQKPKAGPYNMSSLKKNNYESSNNVHNVDEEVKKQQMIGNCSSRNSSYLFNDINDEYKTTHDVDHDKDICYYNY